MASQNNLARLAEEVAKRLKEVSGHTGNPGNPGSVGGSAREASYDEYGSQIGFDAKGSASATASQLKDRGVYHASDAMREMYEMGDAPSCSVCGAIMVRNGSCYRCMSCGSTSGCS
jgi:ribonucleoside-diphosphate reductase alpha chain